MKKTVFLFLLLLPVVVSAQNAGAGVPERFFVWDPSGNYILVQQEGVGYVGLIEGGTHMAWTFTIDDWKLEHIKLTGVSTKTDFSGRHQVVVMELRPDVIKDGVAHGKARYTVGRESKSQKVKATWEMPAPKLTGMWVR